MTEIVKLNENGKDITCVTHPLSSFLELSLLSEGHPFFIKCRFYHDGFLILDTCNFPLLTVINRIKESEKMQIFKDIVKAIYFLHSHNILCLSLDIDHISVKVENGVYRGKINNLNCARIMKSKKEKKDCVSDLINLCFLYKRMFKDDYLDSMLEKLETVGCKEGENEIINFMNAFSIPIPQFTLIGGQLRIWDGYEKTRNHIKEIINVISKNFISITPIVVLLNAVDMLHRCRKIIPEKGIDKTLITFIIYCNFTMFGIEYKPDKLYEIYKLTEDEILKKEEEVVNTCSRILYREYFHNVTIDLDELQEYYNSVIIGKEDVYFSEDLVTMTNDRLKEFYEINDIMLDELL